MSNIFYLHLGLDGTFHIGYNKNGNLKSYRNIDKNKFGNIDFFLEVSFEDPKRLTDAITEGVSLFFQTYKDPIMNKIYKIDGPVTIEILLNENFPSTKEKILKLVLDCIGCLNSYPFNAK